MCRICGNSPTPSNHCLGTDNWFFCNDCFQNQGKRRELFSGSNVISPFLIPKCTKNKCLLCADFKKWKEEQGNALNRAPNPNQNNDDSENKDDDDSSNTQDVLDLTNEYELSEAVVSAQKRRRLRRRDGRSSDED